MNTWFKLPARILYTWKSPMDRPEKIVRNQIDFMLVNKRYRNSCTNVETYPGTDIQSDHVPTVGNFKIRMKKNTPKREKKCDYRRLKYPTAKQKVQLELISKIPKNENMNIDRI